MFDFIKEVAKLPFSIGTDAIKAPKKIMDNMCGDDEEIFEHSSKNIKDLLDS